jgi:hypothetical protein
MLTHAALTSPPADNPAYKVSTNAWGAEHVFSGGSLGQILQRDTNDPNGASWTDTPILDIAAGSARFLQARLTDHGAVGHFNFYVGHATNPADANRDDHVLTIGYNTKASGGQENAAEPAFEWRIEDYYAPGGGNPGPFVEAHWQYYDAAGNGYRPIGLQIDRTTGNYIANSPITISGSSLSYTTVNGTQYFKFSVGQLNILNGSVFTHSTNNTQWIQQVNAAGSTFVTLLFLDSSNRITLGGNNATALRASGCVAPAASGTRYLIIDTNGLITSSSSPPSGT